MLVSLRLRPIILTVLFILASVSALAQQPAEAVPAPKGKAPIIIIPGFTGSELVNNRTKELVWFKPQRDKVDDLSLPISPTISRNRDSLVPRDIIRTVQIVRILPETEIYERLIDALEKRGGYTEGKWDAPSTDGFQDTFYVFPYDWRRDNVENARLLIRRVEQLKRRLRKPDLKFNVIAHSMGGLIARYAAMYGNADLRSGRPRPTWAGARNFNRVFLLGTPNEGSVTALDALLNGFSYVGGGLNLPFIRDISRFDMFTIPSIFQMLPHRGTTWAYDGNLKPMEADALDPLTWDRFGWSPMQDEDFPKNYTANERRMAKRYLVAVLDRARRFQQALDAKTGARVPVSFYLVGGECAETPSSVVIYRDKKDRWKTLFKGDDLEKADGERVAGEEVKKVLFSNGDGVVTKRSLTAEAIFGKTGLNPMTVAAEVYFCAGHNKLVTDPQVQDKLMTLLNATAAATP